MRLACEMEPISFADVGNASTKKNVDYTIDNKDNKNRQMQLCLIQIVSSR